MPRLALLICASLAAAGMAHPTPLSAETLVAAETIRSKTIIGPEHLALSPEAVPGALRDPAEALGKETRLVLYAGRPIRPSDLGPPALVERNEIVTLVYRHGGLSIETDGRSLGRAAEGDALRVLNLSSRTTVTGILDAAGRVHVGDTPLISETQ